MTPIQQMLLGVGKGIPQTNFDFHDQVHGVEGNVATLVQNPRVSADPFNENRWAFSYTDDDGSKDGYIRIVTRNGTTLTFSNPYDAADSSNVGQTAPVWDVNNENKILYLYNSSGTKGRVITVSGSAGSESFSRSSQFSISNLGYDPFQGRGAYALGTTGRWAIPYMTSNVAEIRIITVSSSGIDSRDSAGGSDAINVSQSTTNVPQLVIDPNDWTKGMLVAVNTNERFAARALTFSGTGTNATVTAGSEQLLTPSISTYGNAGGGYWASSGWQGLVSNGSGKYTAFARGGDSPHNNRIVGVAFDYNPSNTTYTLGSATYATRNITTSTAGRFYFANNDGNMIAMVGNYGSIGGYDVTYAQTCERADNRTLTYSNATAIGNEDHTWTTDTEFDVQTDDAQTCLVVTSDNSDGTNSGALSAVMWQLGGE